MRLTKQNNNRQTKKNNDMRLAAIDIGSNGARLLIKNFRKVDEGTVLISRVMYMRIPLRLGVDVFSLGKISKERTHMMKHMLKAFRQIMKLNRVDDYRACATSAMRDADNGAAVLKRLRKDTGIDIETIDGKEEALLLCNNMIENIGGTEGNLAYIDVGGGSTEISLLHNGTLVHSRSYNIGTLRMLSGKVSQETVTAMSKDLKAYSKDSEAADFKSSVAADFKSAETFRIIGSGGNINKLFKLAHGSKADRTVAVDEIRAVYDKLKKLSVEERIEQYGLKADRADVIIPAAEIYLTAADALGCKDIQVPNISLADSIIDGLYRNKYAENVIQ